MVTYNYQTSIYPGHFFYFINHELKLYCIELPIGYMEFQLKLQSKTCNKSANFT